MKITHLLGDVVLGDEIEICPKKWVFNSNDKRRFFRKIMDYLVAEGFIANGNYRVKIITPQ
jgi:predicted transcriptional regulator